MVRGADRRFCGTERDSQMVCCLPGARIRNASDQDYRILKGEGEQPEVMVHIGTNDIARKRDEVLKSEYRELGWKLKDRMSRIVISGLLLVPQASEARNREQVQLNMWLQGWCRKEGFRYVKYWDTFWGRWDLYRKEGLHLNWRATNILGRRFPRALREGLN
eukprot:g29027.t1